MRLSRPTHTTVVAYLALFIAIAGGTAVAAKKIGPDQLKKNAVTTKKIANAAVTTPKLANDAVTGGKLANGAVSAGKIDADAVTANKLAQNSVGTNKIRDEAVESAKIGAGAVTEGKIGNDAVVGSKVAAGSLAINDVAQVVVGVSFNPGSIAIGGCATSGDIPVAGLQGTDSVVVIPTGTDAGWTPDILLGAYGPSGPASIRVEVCNEGAVPIDPPALPMLVAAFR